MPASSYGQFETAVASKIDRIDDVRDLLRLDDNQRVTVEHAIVDRPGLFVTGVIGSQDRPRTRSRS